MRNLINGLILFVGIVVSSMSRADVARAASAEGHMIVPPAISAVLVSPQYTSVLQEQLIIVSRLGLDLRITDFDVLEVGASTYVYIFLSTRSISSVNGRWSHFGSVTAMIKSDRQDEFFVDGVWFTPAAEPPGGVSVGNN